MLYLFLFFFFQAEDGIRDLTVTGVQTCALPISKNQHAVAIKNARLNGKPLKAFPPYTLRHTALTNLGTSGCDVFTLAKIAGHSSITTTQKYIHPQADAIERAFAALPESTVSA